MKERQQGKGYSLEFGIRFILCPGAFPFDTPSQFPGS